MNYTKLMIFLAVFTSTAAVNASDNEVTCPATVKAGARLTITAKIYNRSCNKTMAINRTVLSLIGNSGNSSIGLQGPFVTPFPNGFKTLIAPAKCKSNTAVTPTPHTFSNLVITRVPIGMGGTLAVAWAGVLDTNNKLIEGGSCPISVIK